MCLRIFNCHQCIWAIRPKLVQGSGSQSTQPSWFSLVVGRAFLPSCRALKVISKFSLKVSYFICKVLDLSVSNLWNENFCRSVWRKSCKSLKRVISVPCPSSLLKASHCLLEILFQSLQQLITHTIKCIFPLSVIESCSCVPVELFPFVM